MLLLLDNFEHLLEAAPVVTDLLAAGPRVKILATSRAPCTCGASGNTRCRRCASPRHADARDLTALAARRRSPSLSIGRRPCSPTSRSRRTTPRPLPDLSAARRAAAGARAGGGAGQVLPPAMLLARLGARLPLLTGGTRDAPRGSGRCATPSPGATTCSRRRNAPSSVAWPSSSAAGRWRRPRRSTSLEGDLDVLEGLAALADKSLVGWTRAAPSRATGCWRPSGSSPASNSPRVAKQPRCDRRMRPISLG